MEYLKRSDAMKKMYFFVFLLFIFSFFTLLAYEWEGKIYVDNGVKIIENFESRFITNNIEFEETLSIGKEDGKDYEILSGGYLSVSASDNGDIYIYDGKQYRLLKFDKDGKFIWKIGRKGEGPKEFKNQFCDIYQSYDNNIVVCDELFIKFFNEKGEFIKTIKLDKMPTNVSFLNNKKILINVFSNGQPTIKAVYYTKDGKFISEVPVKYTYGPKLSKGVGVSIGGGGIKIFNNHIYISLPDKYEIREYDLKGKFKRVIKRDVLIKPMNIIVRNNGRSVSVYPSDVSGPVYFYKNKFIINSVQKVKEVKKNKYKTKSYIDFFLINGKYIGSYKVPKDTYFKFIDRKGNFYFIQYDPFPRVYRAKLILK